MAKSFRVLKHQSEYIETVVASIPLESGHQDPETSKCSQGIAVMIHKIQSLTIPKGFLYAAVDPLAIERSY